MQQDKDELTDLLYLMKDKKITSVLEIGTAGGGTAKAFAELASVVHVTTIDPINDDSKVGKIHYLKGSSQDPKILEEVIKWRYDMVFIDGDHNKALMDFLYYSGIANKMIVFHDIKPGSVIAEQHVNKLWEVIREEMNNLEINAGDREYSHGIGIVWL